MANTKKYVSLDKLSLYDEKIKAKIKADDEAALAAAKTYANGLAVNYDAAGAAATAQENAKTYTDGQITTVNGTIAGVKTIAEQGVSDAAAAKAAADAAQGEVDTLEAYVGTFTHTTAKSIVEYVDAKTSGIASSGEMSALGERVTAVEGDVATIKANYLDGDDKTELEGKINVKANQTALDEVSSVANAAVTKADYNVKVAALEAEDARIAGLVSAEAERAAGVESGLKGRIETMEAFWAAAQADGTDSNVVDTLKEIQDYISSDETGAANMLAAIEANEKAIKDMDAAYKAADVTLQGNIDAKADISTVNAIDGRVGALETASATYATKTELQGVSDALQSYSDAHKDDYTNAQIDAAIKVVSDDVAKLNDTYATDAELATAIETEVTRANGAYAAKALETTVSDLSATVDTKAAQSEVNTISGKVGTLEGDMAQAKTDIDAVEAKASANETAIGTLNTTVANKADTTALTAATDRITAIETWHANFVEVSEEEINALFSTATV